MSCRVQVWYRAGIVSDFHEQRSIRCKFFTHYTRCLFATLCACVLNSSFTLEYLLFRNTISHNTVVNGDVCFVFTCTFHQVIPINSLFLFVSLSNSRYILYSRFECERNSDWYVIMDKVLRDTYMYISFSAATKDWETTIFYSRLDKCESYYVTNWNYLRLSTRVKKETTNFLSIIYQLSCFCTSRWARDFCDDTTR